MPKKLENLDKAEWKRMKKAAGIESTPWFKKADASVGSHLKKMKTAKKNFESTFLSEDLIDYLKSLEGLKNAFDNLLDKKDFSSVEAQSLRTEINSWMTEIDERDQTLRGMIKIVAPRLAENDRMARRQLWNENGLAETFDL